MNVIVVEYTDGQLYGVFGGLNEFKTYLLTKYKDYKIVVTNDSVHIYMYATSGGTILCHKYRYTETVLNEEF